jgi:hypothetical protein
VTFSDFRVEMPTPFFKHKEETKTKSKTKPVYSQKLQRTKKIEFHDTRPILIERHLYPIKEVAEESELQLRVQS